MKITDLNIDCIEQVFEHLKFSDLLSAADSNRRLRNCAKSHFRQTYKQKFTFDLFHSTQNIHDNSADIKVYGYSDSFKIARCFGTEIRDLEIKISQVDKIGTKQMCHLAKYLSAFLPTIHILKVEVYKPMMVLRRNNAGNYAVTECELLPVIEHDEVNQNVDLVQLFPTVTELKFRLDNVFRFDNFANHFKYLESLSLRISFNNMNLSNCFIIFLELNKQIKTLRIDFCRNIDTNFVSLMVKYLPNIESLEIFGERSSINRMICMPHLKHLTIQSKSRPITLFPFLCRQLESFAFDSGLPLDFFVQMHPSLKQLYMICGPWPINVDFSVIASSLIEEIKLHIDFDIQFVEQIMTELNSINSKVNTILFYPPQKEELRDFQKRIDLEKKWSLSINRIEKIATLNKI